MGVFDGIVRSLVGAGVVSVVSGIIERSGGLPLLVRRFERNGFGSTIQSWIGTGPNQPISPEDLARALGPDLLQTISEKTGISVRVLSEKIAEILPQAVDKLTPGGTLPQQ